MADTLAFPARLRLIEERAAAFRAAVASAPSLEVQVPTCPEWTVLDLAQHLGASHRRWATIVAAGPADAPPADTASSGGPAAPMEREALLAWSTEATERLLAALHEAGPDRGCWTWWDRSESPQTSGAVARHQVQHVTVHTYDAQITVGDPEPLPAEAALDGVEEFLSTSCAGTYPWPYDPTTVDYCAAEGRSWRLSLAADRVRVHRLPTPLATPNPASSDRPDGAYASAQGTASELVLALYGRVPFDSLTVDGDRSLFDLLSAWDPDA